MMRFHWVGEGTGVVGSLRTAGGRHPQDAPPDGEPMLERVWPREGATGPDTAGHRSMNTELTVGGGDRTSNRGGDLRSVAHRGIIPDHGSNFQHRVDHFTRGPGPCVQRVVEWRGGGESEGAAHW